MSDDLDQPGRDEAGSRAVQPHDGFFRLLTQKFGPLPDSAISKLHAATTEQLEGWTARLLSATTLDEIFA